MTTSSTPPIREKATHPISSSNLSLRLTLGLDLPLSSASMRSCLDGAMAIARAKSPETLTPTRGFSFQRSQRENDNDANFGIVGDPIFGTNELEWKDVVEILRGLGEWIDQREKRGEGGLVLWFRVMEEGGRERGQFGDGYLKWQEAGVEAVVEAEEGEKVVEDDAYWGVGHESEEAGSDADDDDDDDDDNAAK